MGGSMQSRISSTGGRLLSFLLQVICALVEQRQCVPYRDSALTHILKDSLGGSARATVLNPPCALHLLPCRDVSTHR